MYFLRLRLTAKVSNLQLFRERLSNKTVRDNAETEVLWVIGVYGP